MFLTIYYLPLKIPLYNTSYFATIYKSRLKIFINKSKVYKFFSDYKIKIINKDVLITKDSG